MSITSCNAVSDMRLRPHWATWAAAADPEAAYLSIHTNATPFGRADGLTVFYGIDRNPRTPADPARLSYPAFAREQAEQDRRLVRGDREHASEGLADRADPGRLWR